MKSKHLLLALLTALLAGSLGVRTEPVNAQTQPFSFYEAGYRWSFVNQHVYRLSPQPSSWDQARLYAQNHSIGGAPIPGRLATIRNAEENEWIINPDTDLVYKTERPRHWIGFTDNGRFSQEGVWVWISGEPGRFRENDFDCQRFCNFFEGAIFESPTADYAVIADNRETIAGQWLPDINTSNNPNGPWHGVVEFTPPYPGAFIDTNQNNVPDLWEDNNQNGAPDGYEDGPPVPPARNLRAGGGRNTIRLVWDHALSPDLLGYNIQRLVDNGNFSFWQTLNQNGLLLDPVYIDGLDNREPVPTSAMRTYRVESVFSIEGQTRTSLSNQATGTEGEYVVELPAVQTPPGSARLVRYPIGVLNARGIVADGFEMQVNLPAFIIWDLGVRVERTALTESFPELQSFLDPQTQSLNILTNFPTQPIEPLNGEGALVDLFFYVRDDVPVGAVGDVSLEYAFFHTAPGVTGRTNIEDTGSVEIRDGFFPGDVNGDGDFTFNDVIACASLALGVIPPTRLAYDASDLNGDGVIDILDVTLMRTLLAESDGPIITKEKGAAAKGPEMDFELKMVDTAFPTVPGEVDMEVAINMPMDELEGIAGAGFTINYATEHVILKEIQLEGDSFDVLFYDQRDYLRGWKPGRVKVVVSSEDNKIINGSIAKVKFESVQDPMVPSTEVPVTNGKMAKENGVNVAWTSVVDLEEGTLVFTEAPGLDINIVVDDVIDAKDLLVFTERIKAGTDEGTIFYEFSKEWLTPR